MKRKPKLKRLSSWDWDTLVASWRYFENRRNIVSANFPGDIIRRFFSGEYEAKECQRIAWQFYYTDHGIKGEETWINDKYISDSDRSPWCKFYAFCKAWCEGFTLIKLNTDNHHKVVEAFFCQYTQRWYPKEEYINHPYIECYIPNV